jgi:hypothetical protein
MHDKYHAPRTGDAIYLRNTVWVRTPEGVPRRVGKEALLVVLRVVEAPNGWTALDVLLPSGRSARVALDDVDPAR